MKARMFAHLERIVMLIVVVGGFGLPSAARAQTAEPQKLTWDQSKSVYNRRVRPPEPAEKIDWEERVTGMLKEEPGDIIITGGRRHDLQRADQQAPGARSPAALPAHAGGRHRVRQPRVLDQRPPRAAAARSTTSGRRPEFAWEVAAIGINLVSMANNHALDFGPEGLKDCLKALDRAQHHARRRRADPRRGARAGHDGRAEPEDALRAALLHALLDPEVPLRATPTRRAWRRSTRPTILVAGADGKVDDGRGSARGRRRGDGGRRRAGQAAQRRRHGRPSQPRPQPPPRLRHPGHHAAQRRDHVPPGDRRRRRHGHRQRARTSCAGSRSTRGSRSSTASRTSSTSTGPRTRSRSTSSTSATARSRGRPTSRCGTAGIPIRSSKGSCCG